MKPSKKKNFPVSKIRRFLEPGPIVLVSSAWKGERNIMAMGWHMVMAFEPSLVGCYIWDENHSFELIRKSKECVLNVPTSALLDTTIRIGNCSGRSVDKFEKFELTEVEGDRVGAPLIGECFANFECKLHDGRQIRKHGLFIWEVVKAHVATRPEYPETFHYRGEGIFMVSGKNVSKRRLFKSANL